MWWFILLLLLLFINLFFFFSIVANFHLLIRNHNKGNDRLKIVFLAHRSSKHLKLKVLWTTKIEFPCCESAVSIILYPDLIDWKLSLVMSPNPLLKRLKVGIGKILLGNIFRILKSHYPSVSKLSSKILGTCDTSINHIKRKYRNIERVTSFWRRKNFGGRRKNFATIKLAAINICMAH